MAEQVNIYSRWKFAVEIDGFKHAGFQKVSGLDQKVEVVTYRDSALQVPDKSPGQFSTEDLTLEFGATDDDGAWNWFKQVYDPESGKAAAEGYKKNIAIVQQDLQGNEVERWNVTNAFPIDFSPGEYDATSNEKTIRKLVLAYDYFTKA